MDDVSRSLRFTGVITLGLLLLFSLTVAGCGRSAKGGGQNGSTTRDDRLRQIAAEYRRDGDLHRARAALDELGLANPTQLLVALAEREASQDRAREEVTPLARLAVDLGARSPKLIAYLRPTAEPAVAPPPAASVPSIPTLWPSATAAPATLTASPTALPPTATPSPTPPPPHVLAEGDANLRSGPGKAYPVIGRLQAGQKADIIGRNANGDWWQLSWSGAEQAWAAGTVVKVIGPIDTVAVAQNVPPPPPTSTPAAPPPTAAPPKPVGPDFRLVKKRLFGVEENGGHYDGPTVVCGLGMYAYVTVLDAGGNPLDGVTVRAFYQQNEHSTGSDNKGPGKAEFVLYWAGDDVFVARDVDGRQVTSDYARDLKIDANAIPDETLIGAGYCTNAEDCASFKFRCGCCHHYSWEVVFQRTW